MEEAVAEERAGEPEDTAAGFGASRDGFTESDCVGEVSLEGCCLFLPEETTGEGVLGIL